MKTVNHCLLALAIAAPAAAGTATGDVAIPWFKGDVEAAFASAKEDRKPLFLYWGAVWCPPCNQIKKNKIFTRREFAEKMGLFLPVYLDGDTEQAQLWGERLGARGYPTMLVFNPDGEEVTRLPTGLQLEQFLTVLDESLTRMSPLDEVLREALEGDDPAPASYSLLAYYSWGQDQTINKSDAELVPIFARLAERTPEAMTAERARFYTMWLESGIGAARAAKDDEKKPFALTPDEVAAVDARLHEILASSELSLDNLNFVSYMAGTVVAFLHPAPAPARTALIAAWEDRMTWVENNTSLSVDERISALVPALEFLQLEHGDKPLPKAFVDQVRERALWAEKEAKDDYTRMASMSTAGYLLRQVGLKDEARGLYERQLEQAVSPHYFMSSLSRLARQSGDTDEAVAWLRRAYEEADGRATRFQWGSGYLVGLIDLVPDDKTLIRSESLRVLGELLAFDDAFAGRNQSRIKRLGRAYGEWSEKPAHARELRAVRDELRPKCSGLPDEMQSRCHEFFDQFEKTRASL